MKRILLLITATLITGIQAFALSSFPPDMLANKTLAERWFYLDLIYQKFMPVEDSIRFFARAEEIRQLGNQTNDRDLELEADLLELNYLTQNTFNNSKQCVNRLNRLLTIAKDENNTILLARVHNLAGDFYWRTNYERAFEHLLAEYELIKNLTTEQYPPKQKSLYYLGNCYWFFSDYNNVIRYMTEAFNTDPFGGNLYYTLQATNTVGLCYRQLGNLDSADYFFQRANAIAITVSNDAWDGITSGNIGYDLYLRHQYDHAMPLLQKDLDLSVKRSDYGSASGSLITIAEINLAKGDVALAEKQARQVREWIQHAGEYGRLKPLYTLESKLSAVRGNAGAAMVYLDSAAMVSDSLTAKLAALQLLRTEQRAALQNEREAAARKERFKSIALKTVAVAIMAISLLLVVQLLLRSKKSLQA
jgi:tetratricopeptide (TPR) repeat protein